MSAVAGKHAIEEASRGAGVDAKPDAHALELAVWDVPSATGAGERFTLAVGARCSAGCNLGGRELMLFDQHGAGVCPVKLGHTVWPGTEALYFGEAEASAPREAGNHQWVAQMSGWEGESLHTAGSLPVTLHVVTAPECEVTVKTIDRESQAPIANARVVMHPYRAVTDSNGVARVKVPRGQYDLLVSGHRYLAFCASIEVGADKETCAELDADRPNEEMYE